MCIAGGAGAVPQPLGVPSMASALGFQVGGSAVRNQNLGRLALRTTQQKKAPSLADAVGIPQATTPGAQADGGTQTGFQNLANPDLRIPE